MPHQIHFEQWVEFPLQRVFRFFADPQNLPRIMPPKTGTRVENPQLVPPPAPTGPFAAIDCSRFAGVGSRIPTTVRLIPLLPLRAEWIARITEFEWNSHFADVQEKGPFKSFHHRHQLQPETRGGKEGTLVKDSIALEVGFGMLGRIAFHLFISGEMRRTFEYRQQILPRLLAEG